LLTSASVWNVFFVPELGTMIYTMNGMRTRLNLMADNPGEFYGLSAHYSGDGFSTMHFEVEAANVHDFAAWVVKARAAGPSLNAESYAELAKQSSDVAPFTYRDVEPDIFQKIVQQVLPPGPGPVQETNPGQRERIGLLSLYSRYGPLDRSTAHGGLCHEAPAQPDRSSATTIGK
jgi:cytochrome o ubiquinol oxidase subunit II